jgi:probable HAF family extracellular repeat protein
LGAPALSGQSGTIHSVATDINDAGFVVGYTQDPVNAYRAFFWQSGTFTELAVPASDIGAPVEAHALTNLIGNVAIVTGGDTFDPDNNGRHALRWAVTLTPVGLEGCFAQLAQLLTDLQTGGVLSAGEARSLLSKVDAAFRQASQGRTTPARNLLNNIIAEVNQLRASGRLTDAQAQALTDSAQCAIAAL